MRFALFTPLIPRRKALQEAYTASPSWSVRLALQLHLIVVIIPRGCAEYYPHSVILSKVHKAGLYGDKPYYDIIRLSRDTTHSCSAGPCKWGNSIVNGRWTGYHWIPSTMATEIRMKSPTDNEIVEKCKIKVLYSSSLIRDCTMTKHIADQMRGLRISWLEKPN